MGCWHGESVSSLQAFRTGETHGRQRSSPVHSSSVLMPGDAGGWAFRYVAPPYLRQPGCDGDEGSLPEKTVPRLRPCYQDRRRWRIHWRIGTKRPANSHFLGGLENRYPSLGGSRVRIPPPPPLLQIRLPRAARRGAAAMRTIPLRGPLVCKPTRARACGGVRDRLATAIQGRADVVLAGE